jgi:hypothetical protein
MQKIESTTEEMVKSFMSYNKEQYQVINKNIPQQNVVDDEKITFVLGVLATIDKIKTKNQAKYIISRMASELMFNNNLEFKSPKL